MAGAVALQRQDAARLRVLLGLRQIAEARWCIECGSPCKIMRCADCIERGAVKRAKVREHYRKNREKICAQARAKYHRDPAKHRAYQRRYYEANKVAVAERARAYRERKRERISLYRKEYRARNRQLIRQRDRARYNRKKREQAERRAAWLKQFAGEGNPMVIHSVVSLPASALARDLQPVESQ